MVIAKKAPRQREAVRRRDPARTRAAILEASREVIGQGGRNRLTFADVARRARVLPGTVRCHFQSREKLIKATVESLNDELYRAVYADIETAPQQAASSERLKYAMKRLTTFAMENPGFSLMWLTDKLSSPAPAKDKFWRQFQSSFKEFIGTDLAQPGIDIDVSSVLILAGIFVWPAWARSEANSAKGRGRQADRFSRELLRLSLHGTTRQRGAI